MFLEGFQQESGLTATAVLVESSPTAAHLRAPTSHNRH